MWIKIFKNTLKYDVLGNCVVKDDINEAKTRSAVRDPMNLQNKVKFCKKKNDNNDNLL